jgi:hypothetical protein
MTRDPAIAVRSARQLMLAGVWRTAPKQGDPVDKAVYTLRARTPAALAVLGRATVAGLTKPPPAGGCAWCVAAMHAALSFGADPPPELNDSTRAFLGSPCGRCRVALAAAAVAERERGHVDQLVAAGFRPVAAGRLRTPDQVAAYRRSLESLRRRPPAPTGVMWPASGREPAGVTAALQAATRRSPR